LRVPLLPLPARLPPVTSESAPGADSMPASEPPTAYSLPALSRSFLHTLGPTMALPLHTPLPQSPARNSESDIHTPRVCVRMCVTPHTDTHTIPTAGSSPVSSSSFIASTSSKPTTRAPHHPPKIRRHRRLRRQCRRPRQLPNRQPHSRFRRICHRHRRRRHHHRRRRRLRDRPRRRRWARCGRSCGGQCATRAGCGERPPFSA
jgi:hypothetical protein